METLWKVLGSTLVLFLFGLCNGLPINLENSGPDPHTQVLTGLVAVLLTVCSVVLLAGCLCCQRKNGFEEFRNSPVTSSATVANSNQDHGHVNPIANSSSEFTIFTPISPPHHNNNVFLASQRIVSCNQEDYKDGELDASSWFDGSEKDFPRTKLKYIRELGKGWFGRVVEGTAQNVSEHSDPTEWTPVVVRILEASATSREKLLFLNDATIYKCGYHPNILRLLGRSLDTVPLLLLQEFCSQGDLKKYLRMCKKSQDRLVAEDMPLRWCYQLTLALNFLHEQKLTHPDLAARNCQLSDDLSLKLGDYGLSATYYPEDYYQASPGVPLRWCAPEIISYTSTTIQTTPITMESNVWALGVTMWEVLEWGAQPYTQLTDDEVISQVLGAPKVRLSRPNYHLIYTDYMYKIMQSCWYNSDSRVTVRQIDLMMADLMHVYKNTKVTFESNSGVSSGGEGISLEDFDCRWNSLKPNASHLEDINTEGLQPNNEDTNQNRDGAQKSASLNNLHGSLDNLPGARQFDPMESWLENVASDTSDLSFVRGLSDAITDLDNAIAMQNINSSPEFGKGVRRAGGQTTSSESETEDENWRKKIERGAYTEKVRQKSRSVADLMVLTHIDCSESDSETLPSLDYKVNHQGVRYLKSVDNQKRFGSEGNLFRVQDGAFQEELKKLQEERRDSLLFVPDKFSECSFSGEGQSANATVTAPVQSNSRLDSLENSPVKKLMEKLNSPSEMVPPQQVYNVFNVRVRHMNVGGTVCDKGDEEVNRKVDDFTSQETAFSDICDRSLKSRVGKQDRSIDMPNSANQRFNQNVKTKGENHIITFSDYQHDTPTIDIQNKTHRNMKSVSEMAKEMDERYLDRSTKTYPRMELSTNAKIQADYDAIESHGNLDEISEKFDQHEKEPLVKHFDVKIEVLNEQNSTLPQVPKILCTKENSNKNIKGKVPKLSEIIQRNAIDLKVHPAKSDESEKLVHQEIIDKDSGLNTPENSASLEKLYDDNEEILDVGSFDSDRSNEINKISPLTETPNEPINEQKELHMTYFNEYQRSNMETEISDILDICVKQETRLMCDLFLNHERSNFLNDCTNDNIKTFKGDSSFEKKIESKDSVLNDMQNFIQAEVYHSSCLLQPPMLLNKIGVEDFEAYNRDIRDKNSAMQDYIIRQVPEDNFRKGKDENEETDKEINMKTEFVDKVEDLLFNDRIDIDSEQSSTKVEIGKDLLGKTDKNKNAESPQLFDYNETELTKNQITNSTTVNINRIENDLPNFVICNYFKDDLSDKKILNICDSSNDIKEHTVFDCLNVDKVVENINLSALHKEFGMCEDKFDVNSVIGENTEYFEDTKGYLQNDLSFINLTTDFLLKEVQFYNDQQIIANETSEINKLKNESNLSPYKLSQLDVSHYAPEGSALSPEKIVSDKPADFRAEQKSYIHEIVEDIITEAIKDVNKELEPSPDEIDLRNNGSESNHVTCPMVDVNLLREDEDRNLGVLLNSSLQTSANYTVKPIEGTAQNIKQEELFYKQPQDEKGVQLNLSDQGNKIKDTAVFLENEIKTYVDAMPRSNSRYSKSGPINENYSESRLEDPKIIDNEDCIQNGENQKQNTIESKAALSYTNVAPQLLRDEEAVELDLSNPGDKIKYTVVFLDNEINTYVDSVPKSTSTGANSSLIGQNDIGTPPQELHIFDEEDSIQNVENQKQNFTALNVNFEPTTDELSYTDVVHEHLQYSVELDFSNQGNAIKDTAAFLDSEIKTYVDSTHQFNSVDSVDENCQPKELQILDREDAESEIEINESTIKEQTSLFLKNEVESYTRNERKVDFDLSDTQERISFNSLTHLSTFTSTPFANRRANDSTVILGASDDYSIDYYSGLKTSIDPVEGDDLRFSSNFVRQNNNGNDLYSLETWDNFLGRSFDEQENATVDFNDFSNEPHSLLFLEGDDQRESKQNNDLQVTKVLEETYNVGELPAANDTFVKEKPEEAANVTFNVNDKNEEREQGSQDVDTNKPSVGWFLHPQSKQSPSELHKDNDSDPSSSATSEERYGGLNVDEEIMAAIRNELLTKLPHAQRASSEQAIEENCEEMDTAERNEVFLRYNVYNTPLSPIPEESYESEFGSGRSTPKGLNDSNDEGDSSDWSVQEDNNSSNAHTEEITSPRFPESPARFKAEPYRHTPSQDSCCSNDTLFNVEELNGGTNEKAVLESMLSIPLENYLNSIEDETSDSKYDDCNTERINLGAEQNWGIPAIKTEHGYIVDFLESERCNNVASSVDFGDELSSTSDIYLTVSDNTFSFGQSVAPLNSPEDRPWKEIHASFRACDQDLDEPNIAECDETLKISDRENVAYDSKNVSTVEDDEEDCFISDEDIDKVLREDMESEMLESKTKGDSNVSNCTNSSQETPLVSSLERVEANEKGIKTSAENMYVNVQNAVPLSTEESLYANLVRNASTGDLILKKTDSGESFNTVESSGSESVNNSTCEKKDTALGYENLRRVSCAEEDLYSKIEDDDSEDKFSRFEDLFGPLADIRFSGPASSSQMMTTSFSESNDLGDDQDWDSGSDTRSSSSGEFIWKQVDYVTPMDNIQEERVESINDNISVSSSSGSDGEDECPEFVPSAWDKYATPTKSALRSPEKTLERKDEEKTLDENVSKEKKSKGVWFKKQKYHCVYEYPREPESPILQSYDLWKPTTDYATLSDWDLNPDLYLPPLGNLETLDVHSKGESSPRNLYFNTFNDTNIDDDFFVSSSSKPFDMLTGLTSQFFPGRQFPESWVDGTNVTPDSGVEDGATSTNVCNDEANGSEANECKSQTSQVQSLKILAAAAAEKHGKRELGGLRHTRNKLKLDLPPSPSAFTGNKTFTIDTAESEEIVTRQVPTFTTFGKSRFLVQHVDTPPGNDLDDKNVSFEALPHKKPESQMLLVDSSDWAYQTKDRQRIESVRGEASLLDSADEDSGIESCTLDRKRFHI